MMKKYLLAIIFCFCGVQAFSQEGYVQRDALADKLIIEGIRLHDEGKYKSAIAKYNEALKIQRNYISALYEISLSYLAMKNYQKAIEYSNQLINLGNNPTYIDAVIVKATSLAKTNNRTDAINLLNSNLLKYPENYLLNYNLGIFYFENEEYRVALNYLKKAININPTEHEVYLIYAYTLKYLDMWVQSIYSFQFYLLNEPNNDETSKTAFASMLSLFDKFNKNSISQSDEQLGLLPLYEKLDELRLLYAFSEKNYDYFLTASKIVFSSMDEVAETNAKNRRGIFWDLFIPVYASLINSEYFDTYSRYISSCYYPTSFSWWQNNEEEVKNFKKWFEGIEDDMLDDEFYIDDYTPEMDK